MVLDSTSKHRLVGAGIMIVCAAIVLPMVLDGEKPAELDIVINMPEPPALVVPVIQPVQPLAKNESVEPSASEIKLIPKTDSGQLATAQNAAQPTPNPADASESESKKANVSSEPKKTSVKKIEKLKPAVRWTVQIATFKSSENASRLVKKLKDAGYPAYRVTTQSLHKVFVGPEIKRDSAEASRNDIEKEFLLKGIVVKFSPN
ncbi:SPOR domain-containing protein [Marinomonas mediterranea]|jgi:Uncharacterized protein conserved in bacteria|uniref:Sporulation domain-containing protein n=1 Tax=Marinomonas mediterranea (strain ATCC 700492 / JCM 21426 / NBRC 103028 / MMB-1) TaxID=717774 RepID=F2K3Y3_MARM1|nr:SPOR domain-containing protein [Marinomonas mediterranea]ADZ91325.1 Sporulation domain-containing protein [Marinomonas mediterranea MMB-1]WCN09296.1 SPOR domain-containing protein [Marinomonas mediterranea]WCN13378.1 SPOR domain-containing protein [Marinomonas mediterranea]WCN17446.1 SPOR domain-containing protein [Marinomonas mediterranea MMB-1]